MKFELDFYEQFVNYSNRKEKYKFERWLQDEGNKFICNFTRKTQDESYYKNVALTQGFEILGTHLMYNGGVVAAGHNTYFCKCLTCGVVRRLAFSYLKSTQAKCFTCFIERLYSEALAHNLELVGPSEDGDSKRRHYRFQCGHSRDIATGDVRFGQFSCTECYDNETTDALSRNGLESLGRPSACSGLDPTQYLMVKYKQCNHIRPLSQNHLRRDNVGGCTVCFETNLKQEMESKHDMTILAKEKSTYRKIRFNSCGHEKLVTISNMRSGRFYCNICRLENYAKEAVAAELQYIGKSETSKKHKYLANCGHELKIDLKHVRVGHWTCRECNSGYLDNVNYLYLFKIDFDNFSFLKLGYSRKPEYRKYDYKTTSPCVFTLLKTVKVPTGREAISLENSIHAKYKQYNYPSKLVRGYLSESGFTECYPLEIESNITDLNRMEIELNERI